jgi:hypothetical protein
MVGVSKFMHQGQRKPFSEPVSVFHGRSLPEAATPVGYAALIDAYDLPVPVPLTLAAIGPRHKVYKADGWSIYTPRHTPSADLVGHLTFALRYEGLDLAVLKALFCATGPDAIISMVRAAPTGAYARRVWFLYEWLLEQRLDLPDAGRGGLRLSGRSDAAMGNRGHDLHASSREEQSAGHAGLLSDDLQDAGAGGPSSPAIWPKRPADLLRTCRGDLLARTAAFLLLKDSRSSFQIEGEDPPQDRIQRWGQVIGEAGRRLIDREELERLQRIVIGDARFVHLGLRREGGFVGEHDRNTGAPIPRPYQRPAPGPARFGRGADGLRQGRGPTLDPVLAAAILAFGFVYIHPFEDGNGRLHRYLIHHVLAERGFNPPGLVFPVSAVILDRIDDYRRTLESYSRRLLPHVRWRPTDRGNVEVLNETIDFYRYFDATPACGIPVRLRCSHGRCRPAGGDRFPQGLRCLQGAHLGDDRHAGQAAGSVVPLPAAE